MNAWSHTDWLSGAARSIRVSCFETAIGDSPDWGSPIAVSKEETVTISKRHVLIFDQVVAPRDVSWCVLVISHDRCVSGLFEACMIQYLKTFHK